ncbi:hypothetical protein ACHAW6_006634 [Cyclotella cf. meneghiniana]
MGWFDESDSEDNGDDNPQPDREAAVQDDDEDPLDAYMNSLAECPPKPSAAALSGERLDHDAEDEATSHWEIKRPAASLGGSSGLLPPSGLRPNSTEAFSSTDARAMSAIFVRAGGKRTQSDDVAHVDEDGSIDDETLRRYGTAT